jgi:hypothetical protein
MVPHSNWIWTVTTDPVWHFPHQNVTKYIKVSCYSFNMNSMQYFGKYSPCTRCTCTEGIEIWFYTYLWLYNYWDLWIYFIFVVKGKMMLKKIAKIKNFNNFMLRHLVDGIWWYRFCKFYNPTYFSSWILVVNVKTHVKCTYEQI